MDVSSKCWMSEGISELFIYLVSFLVSNSSVFYFCKKYISKTWCVRWISVNRMWLSSWFPFREERWLSFFFFWSEAQAIGWPSGGATSRTSFFLSFFLFLKKFYLFIYLWLCWVFVSVQGLSLVVASGGHSSSQCVGLSLSRPLLLWSTGSRCAGSVVVAHGPSCYAACGIFPDQGLNPCPLHWQADSQPLRHQGSPRKMTIFISNSPLIQK